MREWNLTPDKPLALRFAADSRLSTIDTAFNPTWEIALGKGEQPALSVQTNYAGRVGLVRVDAMWGFPDRAVYAAEHYAAPFTLRAFAPNYARFTAKVTPVIALTFEFWVIGSRAVGGRYTLQNESGAAVTFRVDTIPQIAREGRLPTLKLLRLNEVTEIVTMGNLPGLTPTLHLEHAELSHEVQNTMPKLSAPITIPANGSTRLQWVLAGETRIETSVLEGQRWLNFNWDGAITQIESVARMTPEIYSGDGEKYAAFAFSVQALLRDSTPPNAAALWIAAQSAPHDAASKIKQTLEAGGKDGWIGWSAPETTQSTATLLAFPVLASAAWTVYQQIEDRAFLVAVYPKLAAFFERWFAPDQDHDQDGVPEWTTPAQALQTEHPIFNRIRRWATNLDIRYAETPGLIALLLHEGESLIRIAEMIGALEVSAIQKRMAQLGVALQSMWSEPHFRPRDRDTHHTPAGTSVYTGKGDTWLSEPTPIMPASRIILRVVGGQAKAPVMSARIEGLNVAGEPIAETIPLSGFAWYYGLGTAVTEQVFSEVRHLKIDGLSRVYQVEASTVDLTRLTLTDFLPLWAGATEDQARHMVKTVWDVWRRKYGLPMMRDASIAVDNPNRNAVVFWNALLIDALLERGYHVEAGQLIEKLLGAVTGALKENRQFWAGYHADTGQGNGETDVVTALFPVGLYLKWIGLRIVDQRRVWAGGPFTANQPVTVEQYGVRVRRDASGTHVRFPSSYEASVGGEWRLIEDPTEPAAQPTIAPVAPIMPPAPPPEPEPAPILAAPTDAPEEPPITYKIKVRRSDG